MRDFGTSHDCLKNIKNPVLLTDGRDDVVDKPVNSVNMARQIPFSWLAFFDGRHARPEIDVVDYSEASTVALRE